jgi:gamma-glutamylcyclotransferase
MRPELYFAYGSNLDAEQMGERCPSSRAVGTARLGHHRLDFTYYSSRWGGGAADVLPHSAGEVWGVVYELSYADLLRLDRFEAGYDRMWLEVEAAGMRGLRVHSYGVREKRSFAPSLVYIAKIVRWARHWALPGEYVAALARLEASLSPSTGPRLPR